MAPIVCTSSEFKLSIEGNVGAGKSTFLEALCHDENVGVVEELIDSWRYVKGYNLLEHGVNDGNELSLANFQHHVLASVCHANIETELYNFPIILTDRSLHTQREVFWSALRSLGMMGDLTYAALDATFELFTSKGLYKTPDAFIYLKTAPEVCLERVKARGRSEERGYTLEYLQLLEQKHDEWLMPKAMLHNPLVWVVYTAGKSREDMAREARLILEKIKLDKRIKDHFDEETDSDV